MGAIIIVAVGIAIGLWINSKRVEDHTGDPDALPCPVCRTASPVKTLGYHVCPKCGSRWLPSGSWVIKFRCGHCQAKPVHLIQDPYTPELFSLRFECGRQGNYNSSTKAKWDRKPCGNYLRDKIAQTELWTETTEQPTTQETHVPEPPPHSGRPKWIVDEDGVCTSVNDYEGETEVYIG